MATENISAQTDYEKIYSAVREIYSLLRFRNPLIDSGFVAPSSISELDVSIDPDNSKWIDLNKKFIGSVDSNLEPKEYLYQNISNIFGCSYDYLKGISEDLDYDFWFTDMFSHSFVPSLFKKIKYKKGDEDEIENRKYLAYCERNSIPIKKSEIIESNTENKQIENKDEIEALGLAAKNNESKSNLSNFLEKKRKFTVYSL